MISCVTGKRVFDDEDLAIEALIQHHTINNYRMGEGPVSIFQCNDCGCWHFTSKGAVHASLLDSENQSKMKMAREALDWERKLR